MSEDYAASIFFTSLFGTALIPILCCYYKSFKSQSKCSIMVQTLLVLLILSGFIYSVSVLLEVEKPKQPFDPYDILSVPITATDKQIKTSFRELSKKYHPDKNPDYNDRYLLITKAYQTLTDATAKANYEKYGTPDGPSIYTVIAI
jgi:translocation protein SEC63